MAFENSGRPGGVGPGKEDGVREENVVDFGSHVEIDLVCEGCGTIKPYPVGPNAGAIAQRPVLVISCCERYICGRCGCNMKFRTTKVDHKEVRTRVE